MHVTSRDFALAATSPQTLSTGIPRSPPASDVRWPTRHAKPRGIRGYRIAEEGIEGRPRIGCSSQADGSGFFFLAATGDDPRAPIPSGPCRRFPYMDASLGIVPDSGDTVLDDGPSPSRWRDTSSAPAAATTDVLLADRLRYRNTVARSRGENGAHNPPTGIGATVDSTWGIEIPIQMNQAGGGSREVPLPRSQVLGRSRLLRPEAILLTPQPCHSGCPLLSTLITPRQYASYSHPANDYRPSHMPFTTWASPHQTSPERQVFTARRHRDSTSAYSRPEP
jgi:hypothetical protein